MGTMNFDKQGIHSYPSNFRAYGFHEIKRLGLLDRLPAENVFEMEVISQVLPFRINEYVLKHLINWEDVPRDPIFRLLFPHRSMLEERHFLAIAEALQGGAPRSQIAPLAEHIRAELNPHPGDQLTLNVPTLDGLRVPGIQHKYEKTVLFFPTQGQTCHAYCTFCFRWPQFVSKEYRFGASDSLTLHEYLRRHREISDLLLTGGDPMIMRTYKLAECLTPLIEDSTLKHVVTIRIGTKSLTFWPQRFLSDPDSDDLLRLFKQLAEQGKHVALMAHIDHWCEMESPLFVEAVQRIRETGAIIRSQAPLLAGINDDAFVWSTMWERQVALGIIPYYMFVERDTGASRYFEVTLSEAHQIYTGAIARVSGLARTARGPSMSCGPGKIEITGIRDVNGERVFVLQFLQGRNRNWARQPFFARFDPHATWLDQLVPAFGETRFFFSDEYEQMRMSAKPRRTETS